MIIQPNKGYIWACIMLSDQCIAMRIMQEVHNHQTIFLILVGSPGTVTPFYCTLPGVLTWLCGVQKWLRFNIRLLPMRWALSSSLPHPQSPQHLSRVFTVGPQFRILPAAGL